MAITARARKRRLLTLVATTLVAGMALMPMAAKAVHNEGLFELDGNIAADAAVPGQDWSNFREAVEAGDTAPVSTVFIADGFNGVDDIYFGGGSQNNNDISALALVLRQGLDEERHRARVRERLHQERRAVHLLRRRSL